MLLPDASGWGDAIQKQDPTIDKVFVDYPADETIAGFCLGRLGHLTVNPSRSDNSDALKASYVCSQPSGTNDRYVNWSPENVQIFVNDLIELAEREARTVGNRPQGRLVLLHAPRGAGKTSFLNYVLSEFSVEFDRRLVFWVRLNLTASFGGSTNLLEWIYAQMAKVALRYYDPASKHYDHAHPKRWELRFDELERSVKDLVSDADLMYRYLAKAYHMKSVFQTRTRLTGKYKEEQLTPSLVPFEIGRMVFDIVRDAGYSIIVALDGLDILEATRTEAKRFRSLWDQTLDLSRSNSPIGFQLVAVSRTNTLREIWSDLDRPTNPYTPEGDIVQELLPIDLRSIIAARFTYLDRKAREVGQRLKWDLHTWPQLLTGFREFLDEREGESTRLGHILEMYGGNRRAQMQAVQYAFFDYLRRDRHRPYLVLEALMKAGRCVPPRPYYYYATGVQSEWDRKKGTNSWFDNHMLPSIFVHPYVEHAVSTFQASPIPHRDGTLLGLRTLQFLYAHEARLRGRAGTATNLRVEDVVNLGAVVFGYPRDVVKRLLEEFEQFEIVRLDSVDFVSPMSLEPLEVVLTAKGRMTLVHYVYDVTYLHMSAMRVPLKSGVLLDRSHSYFLAATLEVHGLRDRRSPLQREHDFVRWIRTKVTNAIAMYRLLAALNKEQADAYQSNVSRLETELGAHLLDTVRRAVEGDSIVPGMFDFTQEMERTLVRQLTAIWSSLAQTHQQTILSGTRAWWDFQKRYSV